MYINLINVLKDYNIISGEKKFENNILLKSCFIRKVFGYNYKRIVIF